MKKSMPKKMEKKTGRLAAHGDAPGFETDCRFQNRERRPFPARRDGFSSHIFFVFFSIFVVSTCCTVTVPKFFPDDRLGVGFKNIVTVRSHFGSSPQHGFRWLSSR